MEVIVIFKTCAIATSICIVLTARLGINVKVATKILSKADFSHQ
jgi:hypothetical protein